MLTYTTKVLYYYLKLYALARRGTQTPLLHDESGNDQEEGPTVDGHEEVEKD